jgi:IS30 family transposase
MPRKIIGFVPVLGRLEVRQISTRYLSQDERVEIAGLHHRRRQYPDDRREAGAGGVDDLPGLRRNANPGRSGGYPLTRDDGLAHDELSRGHY